MNCEEAQILSIPHIMSDLDPDSEQYRQLESHLASCHVCAEEYESSEWTIGFIEQHKAIFAEALMTPKETKAAQQEEIQRSWKCIEARLDEFEAQERKEKQVKFRRSFHRISTVVACLVIGIITWMLFFNYSKSEIAPAAKSAVKIELVSKNGNILIGANQQIVPANQTLIWL